LLIFFLFVLRESVWHGMIGCCCWFVAWHDNDQQQEVFIIFFS